MIYLTPLFDARKGSLTYGSPFSHQTKEEGGSKAYGEEGGKDALLPCGIIASDYPSGIKQSL